MIDVITPLRYDSGMGKVRITVDLDEDFHTAVYRHLVQKMGKESRRLRLGQFVREAMQEKMDREQKKSK